jgi:hypothetical protein
MREGKIRAKSWLEGLKERDHLEDLRIDGTIILKWILRKQGKGCGLDSSGSVFGPVGGLL